MDLEGKGGFKFLSMSQGRLIITTTILGIMTRQSRVPGEIHFICGLEFSEPRSESEELYDRWMIMGTAGTGAPTGGGGRGHGHRLTGRRCAEQGE